MWTQLCFVKLLLRILRKAVQEENSRSGLNIRIVEKGGHNIKSILQRSDVKPEKSCNDPTCVVCLTSDMIKDGAVRKIQAM